MKNTKYRQGSGLLKPKYDPRRFSYKKVFGSFPIEQVPNDFIVGEPTLYEQKFNDICTAVSTCYASEIQEGVPLAPEYTFYKTKVIMGGDYRAFGADPDSACKAHIKFGALKRNETPYNLLTDGRDTIANPASWRGREDLDEKAKIYKKFSYFKADTHNNKFDSIRAVLWENKDKKRLVMTGADIKSSWFNSPVVSKTETDEPSSPDMFVIIGSKTINNEPYLIANFSFGGKEKGDGGKFYFPRNIVNKFFFAYLFVDIDPNDYKQQQWSFIQILWDYVQILKNWLIIKKSEEPVIPIDQPPPPPAPNLPIPSPNLPIQDIRTIITNTAIANGIEVSLALAVASCENLRFAGDFFDPKRTYKNKNKSGVVTSTDRGIFMWNDYYHPEVTDEMAFDPEIATKLFCDAVKQGELKTYWSASQYCWSEKLSLDIQKKYNV